MSFREYVKARRITDTPAGDFTGDARRDPNLPDAKSWPELKAYLEAIPHANGVIEAGYQVWQGYARTRKRSG